MAVLRCKMCGGQLNVSENKTVVTCEYCGSKQTLPTLDHEKKQNLFNRANRLRLANEFDKAAGVFESIVAEFPEEAEAYWGLVLCTYGIEYVDDPLTQSKIPTCHRTSYESIFNDVNYDLAMEYAQHEAMLLYRKEAKEIDRLQKEILRIASSEKPFDVFICYKETDETGQRTKDSVLAQDIYERLVEKGFKVFFSRITLEDKLGQQYEPFIFSALNSAKVMLVVGTKFEYFNAVWVKNEWSRFLELMKKDKKKVLIPCYADIDAYDIPNEFRNLQGQDMHKIGFMQDLIRGVGKIVQPEETVVETKEKKETVQTGISPLLKRAFLFLEDKKWSDADAYCERVLDEEPENALAYLGKLMSSFHVSKIENLEDHPHPFDDELDYQKVLRFGDEALIQQVKRMNQKIIDRLEEERCRELYGKAIKSFERATTENEYLEVINSFEEINEYQDSKEYLQKCRARIDDIQKKRIYDSAMIKVDGTIEGYQKAIDMLKSIEDWKQTSAKIDEFTAKIEGIRQKQIEEEKDRHYQDAQSRIDGTVEGYQKAIEQFRKIEDWKDAKDKIQFCTYKINEIYRKQREEQLEKERLEEERRIQSVLIAEENRKKKEALEEQKRLEKEKQEELRRQKEAQMLEAKRLKEEKRLAAQQEKIRRQAEKAVSENKKKPLMLILCFVLLIAGGLGTYFVMLPSLNYKKAQELLANQQYDEAYDIFVSLGDYEDSAQILADYKKIQKYDEAKILYLNNVDLEYQELNFSDIDKSKTIFQDLENFRNSQQHLENIDNMLISKKYEYAEKMLGYYKSVSDDMFNFSDCYDIRDLLIECNGYQESERYIKELEELMYNKRYLAEIGDYVVFGSTEQDGNSDNGAESIEWLVLDKTDDKLLVISKYVLDWKPYNEEDIKVTWETCTLRKWLNNEFFSQVFNEEEKMQIFTTTVKPHENQDYDTNQGNTTRDKIFLLSVSEANQYFVNNDERLCTPSAEAQSNGHIGSGYTSWWLRSTGMFQYLAAYIGDTGLVNHGGRSVGGEYRGIRPAMWIAIEGTEEVIDEPVSLEDASVGDTVLFGSYEQDNDTSNGKEEIEWIVLEEKEDKILVISKYVLDHIQYVNDYIDKRWDSSYLRKWLNNDFITNAFSAREKKLISTVTVSADKNPKYDTNQGNETSDKVFLLSINEAIEYFYSDSERKCKATEYAIFSTSTHYSSVFELRVTDDGYCFWWLRSTGAYDEYSAVVSHNGSIYSAGLSRDYVDVGVRPAMWIDLSIFSDK